MGFYPGAGVAKTPQPGVALGAAAGPAGSRGMLTRREEPRRSPAPSGSRSLIVYFLGSFLLSSSPRRLAPRARRCASNAASGGKGRGREGRCAVEIRRRRPDARGSTCGGPTAATCAAIGSPGGAGRGGAGRDGRATAHGQSRAPGTIQKVEEPMAASEAPPEGRGEPGAGPGRRAPGAAGSREARARRGQRRARGTA